MNPTIVELAGTIFFGLAIIHIFMVHKFIGFAHRFPKGSIPEKAFHYIGEIEVVFGLWAAIFLIFYSFIEGFAHYDSDQLLVKGALYYLNNLNFTEPAFIFVIMSLAATKSIIEFAKMLLKMIARMIPLPPKMAFYVTCLAIGPIMGSFITEPAAMTLISLILLRYYYGNDTSQKFKYATLGLLFVNISIGGTLTHYAAPPVLMVAEKWNWDSAFMFTHFGYKSFIACVFSTLIIAFAFRDELKGPLPKRNEGEIRIPFWVTLVHLIFLILTVSFSHYMVFFLGLFLFFLGFVSVTEKYQEKLKLKEALLVGFFLAGLIALGNQQAWWLQYVLDQLGEMTLYLGVTAMTAITDNAALTYLGSLVELSDTKKYYLVAGAVAGGGLTVIANAPNPAGYGILKKSFGRRGIQPLLLLLSALFPTVIALLCLHFL